MNLSFVRAARHAGVAAVAALLFGVVLVAAADGARAETDTATGSGRIDAAVAVTGSTNPTRDAGRPRLDATVTRGVAHPATGTRGAALRGGAERPHVRVALVATAAALAALLAALAELGLAAMAGAGRMRCFGAALLGARAPPARPAA